MSAVLAVDKLAEQRITEAIERGELSGLPGEGHPLDLDDDSLVPEELRAAYRILKNAGFAPEPVRSSAELARLTAMAEAELDDVERSHLVRRMALLNATLGDRLANVHQDQYRERAIDKLARRASDVQSDEVPGSPSD